MIPALIATLSPLKVSYPMLTQILFAMGLDVWFGESPFHDMATLAGIGLVLAPTAWVMAGKAGE